MSKREALIQLEIANRYLLTYEHHCNLMDTYGQFGTLWTEELGEAAENLSKAAAILTDLHQQIIDKLLFPVCPKCGTELDYIEGREPSDYCPHCNWPSTTEIVTCWICTLKVNKNFAAQVAEHFICDDCVKTMLPKGMKYARS